GRAVGIVLQALDRADDVELVALEVDDAIAALMPAAAPAQGDPAGVVAAALGAQTLGQRLLGLALPQLGAIDEDQLALARSRRLVVLQCHGVRFPSSRRCSGLRPESRWPS